MRKYFVLATFTFLSMFAIVSGAFYETKQASYSLPSKLQYSSLTNPAKKQIECLAENIYFEAGHEPKEGQVAVALVTLNRLASGNYAEDICGVVKQKTGDSCQFSWVCMPKIAEKRLTIKTTSLYNDIVELAVNVVYNYGVLKDNTKGATYYHADYVNPNWKYSKSTQIGRHIFYVNSKDVKMIKKDISL